MKRNINNVISVCISFIRLAVIKLILRSNLQYNAIERISPNVTLDFHRKAKVIFGKGIRVHSGCKLKVRENAYLEIQDGAKMNHNCIVTCRHKIVIGKGTEFGPSVFLYDHDHIHDYKTGKNSDYNVAPIIIGSNCWIGANTVILKGAKLGDNCVIAAGSVVTGEVPSGAIFVQKREATIILPKEQEG